jgi:hypothetical protein
MIFGIEQYLMKKGWGVPGKEGGGGVRILKICRMSLDRYSILCSNGYGGAGGGVAGFWIWILNSPLCILGEKPADISLVYLYKTPQP